MTISSVNLIEAINKKNINSVHEQLKIAVTDSIVLIKNPNSSEQHVLKPKIGIARNALNIKIAKEMCTAATKVASYLVDSKISHYERKQWASILLDMLIIGCNYKQENPNNKNIISYLFECNDIVELNKIREAYKDGKFDFKKLVVFKESNPLNVFPENPNYVSLAKLSVANAGNTQVSEQAAPAANIEESPQSVPGPATRLLNSSLNGDEQLQEESSCCCWPFRG
jgi:hypothetical protein